MSIIDDIKNAIFGNLQQSAAQQAEDLVAKVTEAIPGEVDDKIAADVVQTVEENLGIDVKEATNK